MQSLQETPVFSFDDSADNWPQASEAALITALLRHDAAAWHELTRRYDRLLRKQVRRVAIRLLWPLDSDEGDDVIGTFYVALLANDMRRLRLWADGPRAATLASWLALIARRLTYRHIRRAARRDWAEALKGDDRARHDQTPNRAGAWLGMQYQATADKPRLARNRKSLDDYDLATGAPFYGDAAEPSDEPSPSPWARFPFVTPHEGVGAGA